MSTILESQSDMMLFCAACGIIAASHLLQQLWKHLSELSTIITEWWGVDTVITYNEHKLRESDGMMCCASCGIAEVDEIKLKKCTTCDLVRYCSIKCQKDHRPQHNEACKNRAAALRDEILCKQPESSHLGDCPICCLPLSIYPRTCTSMACCSKRICNGCYHSNMIHELKGSLERKCPFCRHPDPETQTQEEAARCARFAKMKRIKANDPLAMCDMGRS
eukprot:scaffold1734_cov84-Skeletonema_dohrnii-CCMP3373.AAC.3